MDYNIESTPTLVLFTDNVEIGRTTELKQFQEIIDWVFSLAKVPPEVPEFTFQDLTAAFAENVPSIFLLRSKKEADSEYERQFRWASDDYSDDEILFFANDIVQDVQMQLGLQLGASLDTLPLLVIGKGLEAYHYQGDVRNLREQDVKNFIKQYKNGEVEVYVKKQDLAQIG